MNYTIDLKRSNLSKTHYQSLILTIERFATWLCAPNRWLVRGRTTTKANCCLSIILYSLSSINLYKFSFKETAQLLSAWQFLFKGWMWVEPLPFCPEGCVDKLLHASKTGDNLLSNGARELKQGLFLRLNRLLPIRWVSHCSILMLFHSMKTSQ